MLKLKRILSDFYGRGYLEHGIHFLLVEYEEPAQVCLTVSIRDNNADDQTFCIDGLNNIKLIIGYFKKLKRLDNVQFRSNSHKRKLTLEGDLGDDGSFYFNYTDNGAVQVIIINKLDFEIFRCAMLRIENEVNKLKFI